MRTLHIDSHPLKPEIIAEIRKVYEALPEQFYAHELTSKVRANIYHVKMRFPYADTVSRYFRQLREEGEIRCDCISRSKSIYKKV